METKGAALAQSAAERMSVKPAAAYLGMSYSTLDKMRGDGRGPRFLRLGGRVMYRRQDLDAYIEASIVETADSRAAA